jgi:hypothetical protein
MHDTIGKLDTASILNSGITETTSMDRRFGRDRTKPEDDVIPSRFDESGKEYSGEPVTPDYSHRGNPVIPEGHLTNIFPGKGASNSKYVATPIKGVVFNGSTNRYRAVWYHLRHEAVASPETQAAEPLEPMMRLKKVVKSLGASPATLTHEIGHSLDPNIRSGEIHQQDPIIEGVADGFEDRHFHYGNQYEEALDPENPARHQDLQKTSYTVKHFQNHPGGRMAQAAYIAARTHSAMGNNNASEILNRPRVNTFDAGSERDKREEDVRNMTMALGHMYHHHDHVRRALSSMGFGAEGQAAHKLWAGSQTDAVKQPPHPTLFDL